MASALYTCLWALESSLKYSCRKLQRFKFYNNSNYSAIEKITAKKVKKTAKLDNGEEFTYEVDFWNPTVANLTLMALGSSAPEILLSVIETAGGLG